MHALIPQGDAGLVDGKKGFSKESQSLWRKTGWKDVAKLRRQLEKLKELRTLVNSLGRAGGRGPLRRAPEQVTFLVFLL